MSKLSDKIFLSKLVQVEDVVFCSVVNGQRSKSAPDKVGLEEQTEGGSACEPHEGFFLSLVGESLG